ncbi:hypothetical protein Pan97_00330 [Bremerella volcania]|uniref:DUF1559 domain-containing protein n=1 Tax=Bremerella volcania TaxID=2527984 RepID=A0A518C1G8_9BACT|nr:DUF1559 domain-containing protein [Bremerella volcania]QDU73066.1 hypothetical protein Pan97_00330 [Bremerella volcania]
MPHSDADSGPSLGDANDQRDRSRTPLIVGVVLFLVLLVGCVILGPIASALLQVRENARRTACMNHLREIGVQIEDYYEVHNAFPPGWEVPMDEAPALPTWGWPSKLISMTGVTYPTPEDLQQPLAEVLLADDERMEFVQTYFQQYLCPSDDGLAYDGENHPDRRWVHNEKPVPFGLSMYVGNAGHRHDAVGSQANTGIFYGNSAVTLADITDGISHTIMVGERDLTNCRAGSWPGVPDPLKHDGGPSIWNVVAGAKPKINAPPWDGDTLCGEGFSSLHPGGANVLLVDGSVEFLATDTDTQWQPEPTAGQIGVLQQMMIRNDGQKSGP